MAALTAYSFSKKDRWGKKGRRILYEVPFSLITLGYKDSALQQIVKAPLAPLKIILEVLPDAPSSWKFTCWESKFASKHDSIP